MKRVCKWILFVVLLILAVGQLPTAIGKNILILALLSLPIPAFQNAIDRLLSYSSQRLILVLAILACITRLPAEEYVAAGEQMGRFLYGIFEILAGC